MTESSRKPDDAIEELPDKVTEETSIETIEETSDDESEEAAETVESDRLETYLAEELNRYRKLNWILGGAGFAVILIAVTLTVNGILDAKVYGLMMSVGYLFIILMAIVIFTRTRPYKRRLKILRGQPLSTIHDPNAKDGVLIDKNAAQRDTNDLFKIFERPVRTEVIPQTAEYQKLRRQWLGFMIGAFALMAVAITIYFFFPATDLFASLLLIAAFALIIVGFYVDRTKMKPMRNEFTQQYGMTEMQYRDNIRDFR